MDRYSKVTNKNVREIVLLKALPCIWGKCAFCDYIDDNGNNIAEINKLNKEVLDNITGEFGVLEVINSGSCFEIPRESLEYIKKIIDEKKIKKLFLESHWCYKNRLQEMRDFFGIEIIFKIGVETFDNNFRNLVLNKNANFKTVDEVKENFQSVCLLVGIKGQTKEMIAGGTDASAIQRSLGGIPVVGVAAPLRNIHSPASIGALSDFEAVYRIAGLFMEEFAKEKEI